MPSSDARYAADTFKSAHCRQPVWSGRTDDEVREQSLAMLRRYDITAVTGDPFFQRWREEGGDRIMFGSDQMVWPGSIPAAIAGINEAPFLTAAQKRDILHDNAARFLLLSQSGQLE